MVDFKYLEEIYVTQKFTNFILIIIEMILF